MELLHNIKLLLLKRRCCPGDYVYTNPFNSLVIDLSSLITTEIILFTLVLLNFIDIFPPLLYNLYPKIVKLCNIDTIFIRLWYSFSKKKLNRCLGVEYIGFNHIHHSHNSLLDLYKFLHFLYYPYCHNNSCLIVSLSRSFFKKFVVLH